METNQEFFRRISGASPEDAPFGEICATDMPQNPFLEFVKLFHTKTLATMNEIPLFKTHLRLQVESLLPPSFKDFTNKLDNDKNAIPSKYAKGRFEDYKTWLMDETNMAFSGQAFFLKRFAYFLPLADRLRHTYVIGESGSGKSELLKIICIRNKEDRARPNWFNPQEMANHLLFRTKSHDTSKATRALILIDPHGNLADELAQQDFFYGGIEEGRRKDKRVDQRLEEDGGATASLALAFRQLAERAAGGRVAANHTDLIYINPLLDRERFPTINPFDISGRQYRSEQVESYALHIARVFTAMLSGGSQTLSLQMETLLVPCINVLLYRPGSTLFDLQRFMDDENNTDLLHLGRQSENPGQATFFRSLFSEASYKSTKVSIATKCQSLLNNRTFSRIVASPKSTVNLERAISEGKSIVVNCAKGALGSPVAEAFGRFLVAMVMGIALNRTKEDKGNVPIDLVIDECHNFISDDIETILAEARGYGLHLTLAQQVVGQGMSPELTRMVLGNTNVKIVGKSGRHNRSIMSKEMGIEEADIDHLIVGRFVVKSGSKPAIKLQMTDEFLWTKTCMDKNQWNEVKGYMLEAYYRNQEPSKQVAITPNHELHQEILQHKTYQQPKDEAVTSNVKPFPPRRKDSPQPFNLPPKREEVAKSGSNAISPQKPQTVSPPPIQPTQQTPKYEIEDNPFSNLDL